MHTTTIQDKRLPVRVTSFNGETEFKAQSIDGVIKVATKLPTMLKVYFRDEVATYTSSGKRLAI